MIHKQDITVLIVFQTLRKKIIVINNCVSKMKLIFLKYIIQHNKCLFIKVFNKSL